MTRMPLVCLALLSVSALLGGCRKPPEAPTQLDELCKYMYTHMGDEDDDYLAAGVVNLDSWLSNPDNMAATAEGYLIQNLDQDSVNALDDEERDLTGLVGAAVGNDSLFSTTEVANSIVLDDQGAVFPDTYTLYEREWLAPTEGKSPGCFDDGDEDCMYAEAENHSIANYPLGLEAESWSRAQYRWVDTDLGLALVHRTWMNEPVILNKDWISLDHQFYLTVTIPQADGRARRLQGMWMVAQLGEDAEVPESLALSLVISSMQTTAETLETWMGGQ